MVVRPGALIQTHPESGAIEKSQFNTLQLTKCQYLLYQEVNNLTRHPTIRNLMSVLSIS